MNIDWKALAKIEALMREVSENELLPRFGNLAVSEVKAKAAPDDLVTVADIRAETALTKGLKALYPQGSVIGEETATADFDFRQNELLFVIDPVDGTWNFANGLPIFACMIAVLSKGRTIAGLIHYPIPGDTLAVIAGQGVRRLNSAGSTSVATLEGRSIEAIMLPLTLLEAPNRGPLLPAFQKVPRILALQCAAYEYRLLLGGAAQVCVSKGLRPWDHAAGQLMLAELGGFAATPDGRKWPDVAMPDTLISACSRNLWEDATMRLAGWGSPTIDGS